MWNHRAAHLIMCALLCLATLMASACCSDFLLDCPSACPSCSHCTCAGCVHSNCVSFPGQPSLLPTCLLRLQALESMRQGPNIYLCKHVWSIVLAYSPGPSHCGHRFLYLLLGWPWYLSGLWDVDILGVDSTLFSSPRSLPQLVCSPGTLRWLTSQWHGYTDSGVIGSLWNSARFASLHRC